MPTPVTLSHVVGHESGLAVLVSCYSLDMTLTFEFVHDPAFPTSVNNRIWNYFHEIAVPAAETFDSRNLMLEATESSVACVWRECTVHPQIRWPNVVVQIHEDPAKGVGYVVRHEKSFQQFLENLETKETLRHSIIPHTQYDFAWASLSSLRLSCTLGGRGNVIMAELCEKYDGTNFVYKKLAYKGLTFRQFLESSVAFPLERDTFYRELGLILDLPDHPNIAPAPSALVTVEDPTAWRKVDPGKRYICGALYPYHERGSLQELLNRQDKDKRIPPVLKAKWAYQITSALTLAYSSGRYHMDLKPSNMLVDQNDNVIVIDWEQLGASPFFIAPEATGEYDVVCESSSDKGKVNNHLHYTEYTGPLPKSSYAWPARNVFRIWHAECRPALEAAEVYTLGRTLWVIFEEMSEDAFSSSCNVSKPPPVAWTAASDDIPAPWKDFVARTTSQDPNDRDKFATSTDFWRWEHVHEYNRLQESGSSIPPNARNFRPDNPA